MNQSESWGWLWRELKARLAELEEADGLQDVLAERHPSWRFGAEAFSLVVDGARCYLWWWDDCVGHATRRSQDGYEDGGFATEPLARRVLDVLQAAIDARAHVRPSQEPFVVVPCVS